MPIESLSPILFDIIFTNYVPKKQEKRQKILIIRYFPINTTKPLTLKQSWGIINKYYIILLINMYNSLHIL